LARRFGARSPRTGRPLTAAAVNRPLAVLRHLLRLAVEEWEVLDQVPRIRLEREPEGRIVWLEPDEEARLLEASAAAWCQYLEAHARRLYATATDQVRVAAALLASRMARGRLASPFTAREVYRNDWTGLTEPRVVVEALESLRELGCIRAEAVIAPDGGRPAVRFHNNPRVANR
jgi:hypothetical protein